MTVLGSIATTIQAAPGSPDDCRRIAELFRISSLLPGERGRGLGDRLLRIARERTEELRCPELSLICFAANAGARRLYERQGFSVIDRRDIVPHPMIHATGEALLMTAPVQGPASSRPQV